MRGTKGFCKDKVVYFTTETFNITLEFSLNLFSINYVEISESYIKKIIFWSTTEV